MNIIEKTAIYQPISEKVKRIIITPPTIIVAERTFNSVFIAMV
jgi:hypothetical protein